MGVKKEYLRTVDDAGNMVYVQALTGASTATPVTPYGVTTIASTAGGTAATHAFTIGDGPRKGLRKSLLMDAASTRTVAVALGGTIFNGSNTTVTCAKQNAGFIELVGLSTAAWAITSRSTALTFS